MADQRAPRKPRFHAPVTAPYVGDAAAVPALVSHLAALPSGGVGSAVRAPAPGSRATAVDPLWSERVRGGGRRRDVFPAAPPSAAAAADEPARDKARAAARQRAATRAATALSGGGHGDDDAIEDAQGEAAPPPRRPSSRRPRGPPVDARMMGVLSACVRKACGLPSSTPIGKGASPFSAVVVGDPNSRSRAIVLRVGGGKSESAVLWSSRRGGILCSCFAGTQNALFLSASARSCVCRHTVALRRCLAKDGIPLDRFWQRMHLGSVPADFVCAQQYGPMRFWVVLNRSVYSLVSFSAANAATCIAPSCRRFRTRCGHVALARPLKAARRAAATDLKEAVSAKPKIKAATTRDGIGLPPDLPEEDAGIETEPCDTDRGSADAAEATVAARVRRNLLPCVGEISAGEVWARTADWRGMFERRGATRDDDRADKLKIMSNIMAAGIDNGLLHDRNFVPVEPYCGSCGRKREENHNIIKERAVLYTHHPTAPALQVRVC